MSEKNQNKTALNEKKASEKLSSSINANTTTTKSVCDKTEDDVGDEMPETRHCDGICNGIYEVDTITTLECGHTYCKKCSEQIIKDEHNETKCKFTYTGSSFRPMISPIEAAFHDGSLSKATNDKTTKEQDNDTKNPDSLIPLILQKPVEKKVTKKSLRSQKVWYSFLHDNKPLAVCMNQDSSFGDLLRRIAVCLNVNQETHDVVLKIQESSSGESDEDTPNDMPPIGVIESTAKLTNVRLPKSKLLLVEVVEKKTEKKDESSPKADPEVKKQE